MRFVCIVICLLFINSAFGQNALKNRCTSDTFTLPNNATIAAAVWEGTQDNQYSYCKLTGEMERRQSPVDQQTYAIGFEMRLPDHWNKRFLFQGNGGNDGRVIPAVGGSANHPVSALDKGFAVISTDAGHQATSLLTGAAFGFDPLARINYGYRANELLTPIAQQFINDFYQQASSYSYFMGCSNGGRHAMVAASRLANQFDGFLAGNPGFNLPKAAIQHAWDIQALSRLNNNIPNSLSQESLNLLANSVLAACDSLDGLKDGMVQAVSQCQTVFELKKLQCQNNKSQLCLDDTEFSVINTLFQGPTNSNGDVLYASWVYDSGVNATDWRRWKIHSPIADLPMIATLGAGSLANIFTTPPTKVEPQPQAFVEYLRQFDFDRDARKIFATNETFTQSAMTFMTPPEVNVLSELVKENGKLIVYHGASDGVFSVQDTINWYTALNDNHNGAANQFAKLYVVPGMNHCAGGPATDQFDLLDQLVRWVEEGAEPTEIIATVNARNTEMPSNWSKQRKRPLCPYPEFAMYQQGDIEKAESFICTSLTQ